MAETTEKRPKLTERLKTLMVEYGGVALGTWLTLSALVFSCAYAGLKLGFEFDGVGGGLGTGAGAWALLQLTKPVRILATLALTPVVARFLPKRRSEPAEDEAAPAASPSEQPE